MARKPSKRQYLQSLDKLSPAIRKQYLAWVRRRVGAASIRAVEKWVASSNIEMIMNELGMTGSTLADLNEAVRDSYKAGGKFEESAFLSSPAAQFTFDIRNPTAETWLRDKSSKLIQDITRAQRQSIATALEAGVRAGKNPRNTALDILGRKGANGRRTGGLVGLNRPQTIHAGKAWEELSNGDPNSLRNYLSRGRRDRRYDTTVIRAIQGETKLTQTQVNRISGRYADRLLHLRAETIARTETIASFNAARDQAWNQAVEEGAVKHEFIECRWSSTGDARTRDSHTGMNNQTRRQGEAFRSPLGSLMKYPGDTSLGALAEDVVNCRCFVEKSVDFIAQEAAQ